MTVLEACILHTPSPAPPGVHRKPTHKGHMACCSYGWPGSTKMHKALFDVPGALFPTGRRAMWGNDRLAEGQIKVSSGHRRTQQPGHTSTPCSPTHHLHSRGRSSPPWACHLVCQIQVSTQRHLLPEAFLDPNLKQPLVTLFHMVLRLYFYSSLVYCPNPTLPFIHTANIYVPGSGGSRVSDCPPPLPS